LGNHSFALEDCRRAIEIDANYSKAYGRMGLAYASLNDHHRARDCYKKAHDLDPANESYRTNLSIAEDKVSELERQDPLSALTGGLGNFDIGSVLQNPALMQMASQVMSDPAMQNLMSNIMGNIVPPQPGSAGATTGDQSSSSSGSAGPTTGTSGDADASAAAGSAAAGGLPSGLDGLFRAGQAFAARMQEQNPDLINQLRNQMPRPPGQGDDQDQQQQPPPSS
jgi:small glutamine-rich tetratricopeptide repeat-containing protein alpha